MKEAGEIIDLLDEEILKGKGGLSFLKNVPRKREGFFEDHDPKRFLPVKRKPPTLL